MCELYHKYYIFAIAFLLIATLLSAIGLAGLTLSHGGSGSRPLTENGVSAEICEGILFCYDDCMKRALAKSGYHIIDSRRIRTDSQMEATIIKRLVDHGFAGKWRRPRGGLAFGFSHYTPDVELCILHDSMNRRALVEFKAFSATEFSIKSRRRMLAAAKFYRDALCFLYIEKTKQWYLIEHDGSLLKTTEPTPGGVSIAQLPRPKLMIPVYNRYGRRYWTRPSTLITKKTADGLEFVVKAFFYSPRRRRR